MKSALRNAKFALDFLLPLQTPFCLASILAWSNELLKLQKSPLWLFVRKNGVKMANEGVTFLVRVVTFKLAFLASAAVLKSSSSATDNEGRRSGVIATSTTWNLVRKDRCVADQLWVQYYNYCRLIFCWVISQLPGGQFFCEKKTVKTGIIAIRRWARWEFSKISSMTPWWWSRTWSLTKWTS